MLPDLFRVGHFVVRIVSYLLDLVEDRADITFGVELYVPWDAPEAVVDISSEGVVPLRSIPDVIGLNGRRAGVVECRVLQGRCVRSV